MTKDTKQPDTPEKAGSDDAHDNYFRSRFRCNAHLQILSKLVFTARQLSWFDLDTLRLEDSVSVSIEEHKSKKRTTDLLLSVSLKQGAGLVNIIVEHKSYPDNQLIPQLWRYQARCFESGADEVILVTVYHGRRPTFSKSRTFRDYKKNTLPAEFVDDFSHTIDHDGGEHELSVNFGTALINLRKQATKEILAQLPLSATKLGLELIAKIWEATKDDLLEMVDQTESLDPEDSWDLISHSIIYIREVHPDKYTIDELTKAVKERYRGNDVMQKLIEEGSWVAERIRAEASEKRASDIAEKLIAKGMTVKEISTITGLEIKQVDKIRNGG